MHGRTRSRVISVQRTRSVGQAIMGKEGGEGDILEPVVDADDRV